MKNNIFDFDMAEQSALARIKLLDNAGSYHRSWKTAFRCWWKLKRRGIQKGKGIIINKNVDIRMTQGAKLIISDYCIIDSYVYLMLSLPSPKVELGRFVFLGRGTVIAAKGNINIGAFTQIGPFCQINDQDHSFCLGELIMSQSAFIKNVMIGRDCWIGAGSKILKGVTVGDGVVIGAGSIVTKDIPSYEVWAGVPAKFIKARE